MGIKNLRVFLKGFYLDLVRDSTSGLYEELTKRQALYMSATRTESCLGLRSRWGSRRWKSAMSDADARCSLISSSSPVLIAAHVEVYRSWERWCALLEMLRPAH
jgi:hypothetical protein